MISRSACRTATALLLLAAVCLALPGSTAWAIDPDAAQEREARGEESRGALAFLMSFFESLWGSSDSRDAERFSPTINTSQADATAVGSGPEAGSSGSGEPTDPDVGPEIDPGN